jgi:precorrin-6B methylase 2
MTFRISGKNIEVGEALRERINGRVVDALNKYFDGGYSGHVTVGKEAFEPTVGQAGKDVVWVPTPPELVEAMLNLAKVTPQDFVMDLGSGDGRNVIAAARRGARAVGVEFNPKMVELSRRTASTAGVGDKATFVEGDMYEADISKASVLALFLLPSNLNKLQEKFLALQPGSRIVNNTFFVEGWEPDVQETITDDCTSWCTAGLYIVPAKVGGVWQFDGGEVALTQQYQKLSVAMTQSGKAAPVAEGRMNGRGISFTVNGMNYAGQVDGTRITGTVTPAAGGPSRPWTANKVR